MESSKTRRSVGRWSRYEGERIAKPGWRYTVRVSDVINRNDIEATHACVWQTASGKWAAYYEIHNPGQIEDIELPVKETEREAKRAARDALHKHIKQRRGA